MAQREGCDQRVAVEPASAFGWAVALSRNLVERDVADTCESVVADWIQFLESVGEVSEVDVVAFTLSRLDFVVLAHALEALFEDDLDSEVTLMVVLCLGRFTHSLPDAVVVEQRSVSASEFVDCEEGRGPVVVDVHWCCS